ncbi:MAG: rod shape-determining protein [Candidatus Paceibacterota bacterium]|jgi:rod shape-determining protein MreB|nr:rod shape-determining protein [Candidatus Paceibacterota bacterium]MDD3548668.1 rod shape-determining protein [Candidatus Paceibacterota bacterium]MDD4999192.1 rod shape-determining protein [Candidatus Paceibacterota bacterium]MDD5545305.1 rod shape-determining protein [Candidatus Paceibacterota bacterium]
MIKNLGEKFSKSIGVDLGTSRTLIYIKGKGIVTNEPTVVALNNKTNQILAIGNEAEEMVGKTPSHINAIKPLTNGVISDFEVVEKMLRYFLDQAKGKNFFSRILDWPRLVIGIPTGGTEVEKRAVEDVARSAGAKEVYLVEEPVAAALGDRLSIKESKGILVVDVGGGTTEVAVISLGGIVVAKSLRVAGDKLNEDIIYYFKERFKLAIGEKTAEEIKIFIGSAIDLGSNQETKVRGRDLTRGLPKEIKVKEEEIREAITPSLMKIVDAIKGTIEITPPELLGDIMASGVILSGGTSLLRGFDKLVGDAVDLPVKIIEDPITAVIRGMGVILEDLDSWRDFLITLSREKPPF